MRNASAGKERTREPLEFSSRYSMFYLRGSATTSTRGFSAQRPAKHNSNVTCCGNWGIRSTRFGYISGALVLVLLYSVLNTLSVVMQWFERSMVTKTSYTTVSAFRAFFWLLPRYFLSWVWSRPWPLWPRPHSSASTAPAPLRDLRKLLFSDQRSPCRCPKNVLYPRRLTQHPLPPSIFLFVVGGLSTSPLALPPTITTTPLLHFLLKRHSLQPPIITPKFNDILHSIPLQLACSNPIEQVSPQRRSPRCHRGGCRFARRIWSSFLNLSRSCTTDIHLALLFLYLRSGAVVRGPWVSFDSSNTYSLVSASIFISFPSVTLPLPSYDLPSKLIHSTSHPVLYVSCTLYLLSSSQFQPHQFPPLTPSSCLTAILLWLLSFSLCTWQVDQEQYCR